MKVVRLTLALTFAVFMMMAPINAQEPKPDTPEEIKVACNTTCNSNSKDCRNGNCGNCSKVCPQHGKHCKHNCLKSSFGYGQAASCPKNGQRPCPIHGYGTCPVPGAGLAPGMRNATTWSDRPYFGDRPLFARPGYGPHGQYAAPGPYGQGGYGQAYAAQAPARFPNVRTLIYGPQIYMTTRPAEPIPTYTTRGPRDFLAPNPPSIGY